MPAKLSDEKREQAKAILYLNPDVSEPELSRQIGIGKSTAHYLKKDIIAEDPDKFESVREEKKKEFIESAWNVVQKAITLANRRFDKALEKEAEFDAIIEEINSDEDMTQKQKQALISKLGAVEMANIKDIAIALGTIYDKQALASGEPTQITERQEPTTELVKEFEEKVTKLKQLTGS